MEAPIGVLDRLFRPCSRRANEAKQRLEATLAMCCPRNEAPFERCCHYMATAPPACRLTSKRGEENSRKGSALPAPGGPLVGAEHAFDVIAVSSLLRFSVSSILRSNLSVIPGMRPSWMKSTDKIARNKPSCPAPGGLLQVKQWLRSSLRCIGDS